MLNANFTYEGKDGNLVSMEEVLSVFDIYYVGSSEKYYLIPKGECEHLKNSVYCIEDDFTSNTPKVIVTPVPYDSSEGSKYNAIKSDAVNFEKIPASQLFEDAKTALSYHLNEIKLK